MDETDHKTPSEIAVNLVLAARLIVEEASTRITLPLVPPRRLFAELVRLVDDTGKQLEALSIAVHAASRRFER